MKKYDWSKGFAKKSTKWTGRWGQYSYKRLWKYLCIMKSFITSQCVRIMKIVDSCVLTYHLQEVDTREELYSQQLIYCWRSNSEPREKLWLIIFCENSLRLKIVSSFIKKFHHVSLRGFQICLSSYMFFIHCKYNNVNKIIWR